MGSDIVGAPGRIRRVPWAVTETVAGETVLLDPVGDRYLRLNSAGAVLWELLAEPRSPEEVATALRERHGLTADRAAQDSQSFIAALQSRRLVEPA
jgi:hypothetical protein